MTDQNKVIGIGRKQSAILREIMESISIEERQEFHRNMSEATRIYDEMERLKLSKRTFAQLMGVTVDDVNNWISGTFTFSEELLEKINRCLKQVDNANRQIERCSKHIEKIQRDIDKCSKWLHKSYK